MSDSDQTTNAITEQQRIQQLAKQNWSPDTSISVNDSNTDIQANEQINNVEKEKVSDNPQANEQITNVEKVSDAKSGNSQTQTNGQSDLNEESSLQKVSETSDTIQNKDIPNDVIQNIIDDISKGVVEDFSKNIATYVTEITKFDEQYEKEIKEETPDKESVSSNSETNENVEEKTNSENLEQSSENKDKDDIIPQSKLDDKDNQGAESKESAFNPDDIKENDVKDECLEDKKKENEKEDKDEDENLDLLGNGLLKRKVLEGKDLDDVKPYHGDIVTINVSGRLEDDTVIDTFTEYSFAVGEGDVIQAWDLGVMTTKVGQTIELTSDSKYAYGELGRDPDIPPNAKITYTIKLLQKEEAPDLKKLEVDERFSMAEKKRERGNFLFTRNDFAGAINSYNKAINILETGSLHASPEKLQKLADCRLKCCNNMAACQLKVEAYDAAIKSCQSVLDLQTDNVKALFRLGKAYTAKGNTEEGIQYLKKAFELEPESKVIKQEIRKLSQKISKDTEKEIDMYKKMMGTKITPATPNTVNNQKSWKWALAGGAVAAIVAAGLAAYRYGHH